MQTFLDRAPAERRSRSRGLSNESSAWLVRKHTQLSGQSVLGYIDPWGGAVLRRDTKCCSPKCRRKALELEDPFNQTSISTWSIGLRTCIIEDRDEVECKPGPKFGVHLPARVYEISPRRIRTISARPHARNRPWIMHPCYYPFILGIRPQRRKHRHLRIDRARLLARGRAALASSYGSPDQGVEGHVQLTPNPLGEVHLPEQSIA